MLYDLNENDLPKATPPRPNRKKQPGKRRLPRPTSTPPKAEAKLVKSDGLDEVETNLAAGLRGCGQHVY